MGGCRNPPQKSQKCLIIPKNIRGILELQRDGMKKYAKFAALITIVVGTVIWLAFAGSAETKTYYKTISEVAKMGNDAYTQHLRVGGDVESGSIKRIANRTQFVLIQDKERMTVVYT